MHGIQYFRLIVNSFCWTISLSLLFSGGKSLAQTENFSSDILFTGVVPVTCAFEGLSAIEQLDSERVMANRQVNCDRTEEFNPSAVDGVFEQPVVTDRQQNQRIESTKSSMP